MNWHEYRIRNFPKMETKKDEFSNFTSTSELIEFLKNEYPEIFLEAVVSTEELKIAA